jgi:hypothetical protein
MKKDLKKLLISSTLCVLLFFVWSFISLGIIGTLSDASNPNVPQQGWVTILIIGILIFGGYISYKISFKSNKQISKPQTF